MLRVVIIDNTGMNSIAKVGECFDARYEDKKKKTIAIKWWGSWVFIPRDRVEIIEGGEDNG